MLPQENRKNDLPPSQHLLVLLRSVERALDIHGDLGAAGTELARELAACFAADYCALWQMQGDKLRATSVWTKSDGVAPALKTATLDAELKVDRGVVGQVFRQAASIWTNDAPRDARFDRRDAAQRDGLRGAMWLPIAGETDVLAVVELLQVAPLADDDQRSGLLDELGKRIGRSAELVRASRRLTGRIRWLESAEHRWETTLQSIGDGVIVTDEDERVVFMNPAAERWTGWTLSEARRKALSAVFPLVHRLTNESIHGVLAVPMRDRSTSELPADAVLVDKMQRRRLVADSRAPILDSAGKLLGGVVVFRDVTDEQRQKIRRAFLEEASSALLSSLDYETTLTRVAELATRQIADWCVVDVVGEDGELQRLATWHKNPEKAQLARELRDRYAAPEDATVGPARVVVTGRPELASEIPASLIAENARDEEHRRVMESLGLKSYLCVPLIARGRTLGTITLCTEESGPTLGDDDLRLAQDLAARAALAVDNAQLFRRKEDALGSRDEFMSIAAHELRTPLTTLQLHLQMLGASSDVIVNKGLSEKMGTVLRQVQRLGRLVERLLDVAKLDAAELQLENQQLDLGELVQGVAGELRPHAEAAGVAIDVSTQSAVGCWDLDRLIQVVESLLLNAIKYAPGSPVEVSVSANPDEVRLQVRDHGIGIASEDQARIFDRFERAVSSRHYGGLGLGLFVAHRIVEAHGGRILVESTPGEGATFTVVLPRSRRPVVAPPTTRPGSHPERYGRQVLLVDDDPELGSVMVDLLKAHGHQVRVAVDGEAALRALQGSAPPPDLVLLDMMMPKMDGWQLMSELKEDPWLASVPVVLFSASAEIADAANELGAAGYLKKPATADQLLEVIRDHARPPA